MREELLSLDGDRRYNFGFYWFEDVDLRIVWCPSVLRRVLICKREEVKVLTHARLDWRMVLLISNRQQTLGNFYECSVRRGPPKFLDHHLIFVVYELSS